MDLGTSNINYNGRYVASECVLLFILAIDAQPKLNELMNEWMTDWLTIIINYKLLQSINVIGV